MNAWGEADVKRSGHRPRARVILPLVVAWALVVPLAWTGGGTAGGPVDPPSSSAAAAGAAPLPAFPGAEGFGATTPGGRGGRVLVVDSLADDGTPGTLRWALLQPFPRVIVFRASGIIRLREPLWVGGLPGERFSGDNPYSFVTIAGQSAPGGGITLAGFPLSLVNGVHDVVIRHLRIRNSAVDRSLRSIGDGIEFRGAHHVVVDHVSVSWASDEGISVESEQGTLNHDITVQRSLVAETLSNGGHPCGCDHSRGMVASDGTFNVSFHHNLLVSHNARNPSLAGNSELGASPFPLTDVRYNLVYNFGETGVQFARGALTNVVGNVIRFGPDTRAPTAMEALDRTPQGTEVYLDGNCEIRRAGGRDVTTCPRDQRALVGGFPENVEFVDEPFAAPAITPPHDLVDRLLATAGALPRDAADEGFVSDYRAFEGDLGAGGRSHDQIEVPSPAPGDPEPDGDLDGMPDAWERGLGLDPDDPGDASTDRDGDGYTAVEEYLNELAAALEGPACPGREGVPGNHLVGTRGADVLLGAPGPDVVCGLGGADVIRARGGGDLLLGGAGADRLLGQAGDDVLLGQGGDDVLKGGGGSDRCTGGPGEDRITGCENSPGDSFVHGFDSGKVTFFPHGVDYIEALTAAGQPPEAHMAYLRLDLLATTQRDTIDFLVALAAEYGLDIMITINVDVPRPDQEIARGQWDDELEIVDRWIDLIPSETIYIRPLQEFASGFNEGRTEPDDFVDAYTHMFDILEDDRVEWVWHPNKLFVNEAWWPGAEFVDWYAMTCAGRIQTCIDAERLWKARFGDRPFMLAEASPQAGEFRTCGIWCEDVVEDYFVPLADLLGVSEGMFYRSKPVTPPWHRVETRPYLDPDVFAAYVDALAAAP